MKKKSLEIAKIFAYEVFDSRGFPTVACVVELASGHKGEAMVPSGASTGEKEALELRDGDKSKYNGKGVSKAVSNVNKLIAPKLIGKDASKQEEIDNIMLKIDGTPNKGKLGANATLAVSIAVAKAAASALGVELYRYFAKDLKKTSTETYVLPVPMLNVINGGAHADNTIDFQEFMFMPLGAKTLTAALRMASECFHSLQSILKANKFNTNKGDEGGFAPNLKHAEEALDFMVEAVKKAGYVPGKDVAFALDCASSEFYDETKKVYILKKALKAKILSEKEATFTSRQMIDYLKKLVKTYPIVSIEDGLSETDWEGMALLTKEIGGAVQIVGDDTYCTNPKIVEKGIKAKTTNAVLVKLNQIGTVTETLKTISLAHNTKWAAVVSHRSGETEDTTIADLSVGLQTGQIKTGSMSRSERIAKYNRLLRIELELGKRAKYLGWKTFKNIKPTLVKK
ncbi:phosphopyruvate hydratase [[Mycoplasma] testudinis]|uniref:phosphopyruvate hydratase n=1 Tax=[Mycoplasma] testudinis TaxID=33924 RepID=UPI0004894928|nr:phosphopyruvate hydratase [[Mycoplasma] testudinis]